MKKINLLLIIIAFFSINAIAQDEDYEGCKDHPMFNRMPNSHIMDCDYKEFDGYNFTIENSTDDDAKKQTVEGKYYYIGYHMNENANSVSDLQIYRNFENALIKIKAQIVGKVVEVGNSYSFINAKIVNGNTETWVNIHSSVPEYYITIVEKQTMQQVIEANVILESLNKDGFIALDILFDTGKSTIKSESQSIIDELVKLMKENPSLKISIEGHTDNVGNSNENKILSQNRAKSVMDAVISKGISKERMSYVGWGQERPVADNRTEEGRAKNRRVEIVKK